VALLGLAFSLPAIVEAEEKATKSENYHKSDCAKNLKWIMSCFELMSGMRINYHKGELVPINIEQVEEVNRWAEIFGCPVGAFPIKYLGIPFHYTKLSWEDLQPLVDRSSRELLVGGENGYLGLVGLS
jgi:hypothetical protein